MRAQYKKNSLLTTKKTACLISLYLYKFYINSLPLAGIQLGAAAQLLVSSGDNGGEHAFSPGLHLGYSGQRSIIADV
jgi:hypothetical protein